MAEQIITQELLHSLFEYKNGELFWKINSSKRTKIGTKAGCLRKHGYSLVCIKNKRYYIHRIIFMMFNGYMPEFVDHIDNSPLNNKIENLRSATKSENQHNRGIKNCNTSGYKNVTWNKKLKKWQVAIKVNKKDIYIGVFKDLELADLIAQEARNKYHKNFARNQ